MKGVAKVRLLGGPPNRRKYRDGVNLKYIFQKGIDALGLNFENRVQP